MSTNPDELRNYSVKLKESIKSLEDHNTKIITALGENVQNLTALFGNLAQVSTNAIALAKLAANQLSLLEQNLGEKSLVHENVTADQKTVIESDLTPPEVAQWLEKRAKLLEETKTPITEQDLQSIELTTVVSPEVVSPKPIQIQPEAPVSNQEDTESEAVRRREVVQALVKFNEANEQTSGEQNKLAELNPSVETNHHNTKTSSPVIAFKDLVAGLIDKHFALNVWVQKVKLDNRNKPIRFFSIDSSVFTVIKDFKQLILNAVKTERNYGVAFFLNAREDEQQKVAAIVWDVVINQMLVIENIEDLSHTEIIDFASLRPLRPIQIDLQAFNTWMASIGKKLTLDLA